MASIQTAFVTGATGFIGRALCAKLEARGAAVRSLARRQAEGPWERLMVADIARGPVPAEALEGVDTVFHLAGKVHALAEVKGGEAEYVATNVEGTRRVLEAAAAAGVKRFVFMSSVKAGGEGSGICQDEAAEDYPETPYGHTKLEAERLVFRYGRERGMHAAVLRLPLVYGPGPKGNLARMLRAVARRRFPPLPEFGNRRSMVHVADAAEAAILAAESPEAAGQMYIVTDGLAYSTRDLYVLMRAALGRRRPVLQVSREMLQAAAKFGDIVGRMRGRRFVFDSDALEKLSSSAWYRSAKIEKELGFKPEYDLEKALPEMIEALGLKVKGRR